MLKYVRDISPARLSDEATYLIILDQCLVIFVSDTLIRSPLASDDIEACACELHRRLSRRCHFFKRRVQTAGEMRSQEA